MGVLKWIVILLIPVSIAILVAYCVFCPRPVKPQMVNGWWGYRDEKDSEPPSTTIDSFSIKVPSDVLNDLKSRLINTRTIEGLPGTNFEYGFNVDYMKEVVEYWKNKYDWKAQEAKLNSFPQFTTVIEGISVHFLHVKPAQASAKTRPLLMIHGWPGSFWEFYKIIPMLTGADGTSDVAFELIIPSIPGYGFSEAPHRPGFSQVDAARVFYKLMKRLGHSKYYIQGGDWGSFIARIMAQLYDSNVLGLHLNMASPPMYHPGIIARELIGMIFPSLIFTPAELVNRPSIKQNFMTIMRESGYMHIQATRPDSVAMGLNDSPVGLAAYIMEKFSVWSNSDNRFCPDGCLTKHFTLDEVLTNIMIYWVTGSIASSVRFYRELFTEELIPQIDSLPVEVPTGFASFPHEIIVHAEALVRATLPNIVQYNIMPRGGHFAAMEEPRLLADDIISFVKIVEKLE